ncbi:hypothetical protein BP5796_05383 [Coleophoma crateriformis]|uniref:SRR1-like domain-containing protein n=1 Tax=Coleophoma crateriformis TaxID=565419 RepID=A0A3D8S333_9HELO|nr:hypothetical protein BP5796_05383 [Coleophoma crateriformis]
MASEPPTTTNQIKNELEVVQAAYRETPEFTALQKQLREQQQHHNLKRIGNIVVLGTGSPQHPDLDKKKKVLLQFATVLALATELEFYNHAVDTAASGWLNDPSSKCHESLAVVAEDEMFIGSDMEFLASLGITCVGHGMALKSITSETLLYAVGTYPGVFKSVCHGCWPAAIISGEIEGAIKASRKEGRAYTNAEKNDVRDMIKDCEQQPFAGLVASSDQQRVIIYWRKSTRKSVQRSSRNYAQRFMEILQSPNPFACIEPNPNPPTRTRSDLSPNPSPFLPPLGGLIPHKAEALSQQNTGLTEVGAARSA